MKTLYCISGLGADEKIIDHLNVNARLKFIPWLRPLNNEKIENYAWRMGEGIHHQTPVLLGVSFGGMIAIEIAKQMKVGSLIVISSVKTFHELPRWMRMAGRLYLHKIIPTRSYKFTEKFDNQRLGVTNDEERNLVNFYRQKLDPVYSNWAIHQVLSWKNSWVPESMVHIHGEEDKIFPIKNVRPTHVIKRGTHLMIVNRGDEVSQCINAVL